MKRNKQLISIAIALCFLLASVNLRVMRTLACLMRRRILISVTGISLTLVFVASLAIAQVAPFSTRLKLQGVTFTVKSPNRQAGNQITISTMGLTRDDVITKEVKGVVTGAEVGDLNVDGAPEIYIYVSEGKARFGHLVAFSCNKKRSMTEIYLPEISSNANKAAGYRGRDEFAVVENTFVRLFPIYKTGDSEAEATGGTRQFQYKLKPGETGWMLALDKVIEF